MTDEKLTPDYVYDPSEWEATFEWSDRAEAVEEMPIGGIKKLHTLSEGPMIWAAHVPVAWDDDGAPDETEVQWFDTEEAAEAALGRKPSDV